MGGEDRRHQQNEEEKKSLFPQILRIIAVLFVSLSLKETSRKSGSFPWTVFTQNPRGVLTPLELTRGPFLMMEKNGGKVEKESLTYREIGSNLLLIL